MQYGMGLDHAQEGDEIVERGACEASSSTRKARTFLNGSTIDYADDLAGSGFRIQNPNAVAELRLRHVV